MGGGVAGPRRLALLARTPIPQKLPRINPQFMPVIEVKLNCVLADAIGRRRFYGRLEHRERPRRSFHGLSWLLVGLAALLIAKGTRASIAEERKGIMRLVAIFPLDIETRSGAQVDLYRLRVRHRRHEFSIAQLNLGVFVRLPDFGARSRTGKVSEVTGQA